MHGVQRHSQRGDAEPDVGEPGDVQQFDALADHLGWLGAADKHGGFVEHHLEGVAGQVVDNLAAGHPGGHCRLDPVWVRAVVPHRLAGALKRVPAGLH